MRQTATQPVSLPAAHLVVLVVSLASREADWSACATVRKPASSLPLRFHELAHASPEATFLLDCSRRSRQANVGPLCGSDYYPHSGGSDGEEACNYDNCSSSSGTASQRWTFAHTYREVVAVGSALCTADAALPASHATPSVRVVALFGGRSPRSYIALLAAWLAPCRALTVAPLSPWATAAELRRLLALASPTTLVLTTLSVAQADALRALQQETPEVLSTISAVVELADIPADILPWCQRLRPHSAAPGSTAKPALVDSAGEAVDGNGEAIALLLFTSGSTASPKPVMVPHRQLCYGSDTLLRDGVGNKSPSSESSHEVVAAAVSLHWDVASYDLGLALTLPAALLVLPEDAFDRPLDLRQAMATKGATVLFGTPSTLERVLLSRVPLSASGHAASTVAAAGTLSLSRLRCIISTGEPFSATLAARCRATVPNLQVMDCYGATEFSNVVSRILPEPSASGQVQWDGLPFDRSTMSLRNPTQESDGGISGELVLSTPGLMRGYLSAEMQQQIEFRNHSTQLPQPLQEYATGDLVRVRTGGPGKSTSVFDVIGRADRQVHVDGVRHNLDALEALFEESKIVAAAVCLLWRDRTRIHVFLSLSRHAQSWSDDSLSSALSQHAQEVVNAMMPTDIHILSDDEAHHENVFGMPLTPTGKKNRRLLRAQLPHLEAEARNEMKAQRIGLRMWLDWGCSYVLTFVNAIETTFGQRYSHMFAWCQVGE